MPSYSGVWNLVSQYQAKAQGLWVKRLNFISILGGSGAERPVAITSNNSGTFFTCGAMDTGGPVSSSVIKYTNEGDIIYQKSTNVNSSPNYVIPYGMVLDTAGNLLVVGFGGFPGFEVQTVIKLNDNAEIIWQKSLGFSGSSTAGFSVSTDSANSVIVSGRTASSIDKGLVNKFDSSGNLSWQRALSLGTGYHGFSRNTTNAGSGDVFIAGYSANGTFTVSSALIVKYNTSGTIQWQRLLGTGSGITTGGDVVTDSTNNVYVVGTTPQAVDDLFLAKYNTSGTLQWQRRLSSAAADSGNAIAIDSAGFIYVGGSTSVNGYPEQLIAKYNSDGTLQWQRTFGTSGAESSIVSIAFDGVGNMYLTGAVYVSGAANFLTSKFPVDGSLTGSYVIGGRTYTYAVSTLTASTPSLSSSTGSLTNETTTLAANITPVSIETTNYSLEIISV